MVLFLSGYANSEQIADGVEEQIALLQKIGQKIAGKSDLEVAAMMDTNGDGKLAKDELKQGVVDLRGTELDGIASEEIDMVWENLLGSEDVVDLQDEDEVSDRFWWSVVSW